MAMKYERKILNFLLMCVLLSSVVCSSMNARKSVYRKDNNWVNLYVPTDNVGQGVTYRYDSIPLGWRPSSSSDNCLSIPVSQLSSLSSAGSIRVTVLVNGKQTIKRGLNLKYSNNGGLQVGDYDLGFGPSNTNYYSAEQFNGSEDAFNNYIDSYNSGNYGGSSFSGSSSYSSSPITTSYSSSPITTSYSSSPITTSYSSGSGYDSGSYSAPVSSGSTIYTSAPTSTYSSGYAPYSGDNNYETITTTVPVSIPNYSGPSNSEIEENLSESKYFGFMTFINTNIRSITVCQNQITFLQNSITILLRVIQQRKSSNIDSYTQTINSANEQINILLIEIKSKQSQYSNTQTTITNYNSELTTLTINLQSLNNNLSTLPDINSYTRQKTTLTTELQTVQRSYSELTTTVSSYRSDISIIENDISALEIKLASLRQRRVQISSQIQITTTKLTTYQTTITTITNRITTLTQTFESQNGRRQQIQNDISNIQIQIQTLRSNIQRIESSQITIKSRIDEINIRISSYRRTIQTTQTQLASFTRVIQAIYSFYDQVNTVLITIRRQCTTTTTTTTTRVDKGISGGSFRASGGSSSFDTLFGNSLPFNPQNGGSFTITSTSNQQSFNPDTFISYISNLYGSNAFDRSAISSRFNRNDKINVSPFNFQSSTWGRNYGFPEISSGFGSNTNSDCSGSSSGGFASYGTINSISRNTISVSGGDGKRYTLNLDGCSNLEGVGSSGSGSTYLPQIGNRIVWKGAKQSNGSTIRVRHATCY